MSPMPRAGNEPKIARKRGGTTAVHGSDQRAVVIVRMEKGQWKLAPSP